MLHRFIGNHDVTDNFVVSILTMPNEIIFGGIARFSPNLLYVPMLFILHLIHTVGSANQLKIK